MTLLRDDLIARIKQELGPDADYESLESRKWIVARFPPPDGWHLVRSQYGNLTQTVERWMHENLTGSFGIHFLWETETSLRLWYAIEDEVDATLLRIRWPR